MKILIISRTPWDNDNSFGNTFSNLFSGMEDVTVYNICCQGGKINNSVTHKSYQMSETMLINGLFGKPTGRIVEGDKPEETITTDDLSVIKKVSVKRTNIALMVRDLIWKVCNWKNEKALDDFLKEAKPDVIYLPIYASWYMCDIQQYFIKKTGAKVVGHISDDVYSYPKDFFCSPLTLFYKLILRNKLRSLISKTEYLEVFAENMKMEYEKTFKKECFFIGKGVTQAQINQIPQYTKEVNNNALIHIVYTGNIGGERFEILSRIGEAIDKSFKGKAVIDVYTQTTLSKKDLSILESIQSINLCGSISANEVKSVQRNANVLLHMEGFSKKSVYETRMSFSTKIIDYMLTGVPIFAVGPEEINSISFLKSNNLAVVATSDNEISDCLECLIIGSNEIEDKLHNIKSILRKEKDIIVIQNGIYQRLTSLL